MTRALVYELYGYFKFSTKIIDATYMIMHDDDTNSPVGLVRSRPISHRTPSLTETIIHLFSVLHEVRFKDYRRRIKFAFLWFFTMDIWEFPYFAWQGCLACMTSQEHFNISDSDEVKTSELTGWSTRKLATLFRHQVLINRFRNSWMLPSRWSVISFNSALCSPFINRNKS